MSKPRPPKVDLKVEKASVVFRFANYALLLFVMLIDAFFGLTWSPPEYFYIVILGVIIGADGKAILEKVTAKK